MDFANVQEHDPEAAKALIRIVDLFSDAIEDVRTYKRNGQFRAVIVCSRGSSRWVLQNGTWLPLRRTRARER